MERVVVTTAGPAVEAADLPEALRAQSEAERQAVVVHRLVALTAAQDDVERQLLDLARRQGRTTYEMARLLGINQSTVVRKLQRHFPGPLRRPGPHPWPPH